MAEVLYPAAQKGVGVRIAHDPGDPLITSHCPFCGSGQVVGRSDGTISCDFCGQVYIVRVQPAFPGMPQMPNGPGAPSDIGPDGGILPPDAVGPDGLPIGGEEDLPPGAEEDEGGFPPDAESDDEGFPPEDDEGPPEDEEDGGDEPPPPPKKKGKSKKESVKTYRGPGGQVMTEDQYVRHLAAGLSGNSPAVLAQLRAEAGASMPVLPRIPDSQAAELDQHLQTHHGFAPGETGYQPDDMSGYTPAGDARLGNLHDEEHAVARDYQEAGQPFPPGVMPIPHAHPNDNGAPLEAWETAQA